MKFTYLGTAAAEAFPAVFCNCKYCQKARVLKGKNIRTRSQAIINEDLLLDLPADTYFHVLQNELRLDKVKFLLVTHAHSDHFYPQELRMRGGYFARDMQVEKLHIYCGKSVYDEYKRVNDGFIGKAEEEGLIFHVLKVFERVSLGEYTVTALPARHMLETDAFIYLISDGDKTLLYAHDTGYFYEEVIEYLKENKVKLDFITFDCTNVCIPIKDQGGHMGFDNIIRLKEELTNLSIMDEKTVAYVNHFSHNANPLQEVLEEEAKPHGLEVAFDGLTLEI